MFETFAFFLGFLAGVLIAVALVMLLMVSFVKKSNDWGDSDGSAELMDSFTLVANADRVSSNYRIDNPESSN